MSFENKSRVGNLQDMPLGEDRLFNLDLFNKEPISIPLLNTMNFGWNRFPIREGLNIAEAEGAITSEKEGTVSPGFDLAHDSGVSRTTGMQPINQSCDHNLGLLRAAFISDDLVIDNDEDSAAIVEAINTMSIEYSYVDTQSTHYIPKLPFIIPYQVMARVGSTHRQDVFFESFFIPICFDGLSCSATISKATVNSYETTDAGDLVISGYSGATDWPAVEKCLTRATPGWNSHVDHHCLTETIACDMWSFEAVAAKTIKLSFNVQEVTPMQVDNNKSDNDNAYHIASQGYLLCNVSSVIYDGVTQNLNTDYPYIRFTRLETQDIIEPTITAWNDYMFPVKDEICIGFLVQSQAANDPLPALPTIEVGAFGGIANARIWASNLPFVENTDLTKIDDIKLFSSQILEDSPKRLLIMASFHFSDTGTNAGVRTFLFDYKTPSSFTGGYYVKDFDDTKKLYVSEITDHVKRNPTKHYYEKTLNADSYDYSLDFRTQSKYARKIATTIYAGGKEFASPLLETSLNYGIGQDITFVDTTQQDGAFLAVHDFKSFIMPAVTIPMIYPSITLFSDNPVTYNADVGFTIGGDAKMDWSQFYWLYHFHHGYPLMNTVHFFKTTPMAAGNVWSSMPMDSETYFGIDLNQHDIPITSKLLQLNDKMFSLVNGVVYESTYNRVLNANLLKKVSDASEGAYVMANLLLTGSDRATDIYSYTKDTGIAHIVTIPDAICARPYMVKDVAMIPTRSFDNAHIRIYAFRENILKLVKDIPVTLAMPDETYTNYTDSPGLGCPWTLQNVLTHRLDNGNLGLSYLQYDSMIPAMYLYSSIITADAGISDVTTKMETDNVKFIPYYQHEGNDTMAYSLTDKQYEVTTTDVTEYSITSHRLSIPERYNQRFIGTQIVIQLEDFLLIDNILSFRYVLNGASTVTTSSFTSYTKDKIIIDLDMREIDSISYEIDITQDSSDIDIAIKNVVLVGYYTSTTY